jgi:hypothetical protein
MTEGPRYEWYIDWRKVRGCGVTIAAAAVLAWLLYLVADLLDKNRVDMTTWATVSQALRPIASLVVLVIIVIAFATRRPPPLPNGPVSLRRDAFPTFTVAIVRVSHAFRFSWLPRAGAATMLFFSLTHQPYDFYVLLRWLVSGTAGLLLAIAVARKKFAWAWLAGMTCVLFNPLKPIHLSQTTSHIIDVAGASFFLLSLRFVNESKTSKASSA